MLNKILIGGLAIAAALAVLPLASAQNTQPRQATRWAGEPAPVFRVQEVVAADIIQGPDYVIAQDVPVRDYKYLFTLHTPYGAIIGPRITAG